MKRSDGDDVGGVVVIYNVFTNAVVVVVAPAFESYRNVLQDSCRVEVCRCVESDVDSVANSPVGGNGVVFDVCGRQSRHTRHCCRCLVTYQHSIICRNSFETNVDKRYAYWLGIHSAISIGGGDCNGLDVVGRYDGEADGVADCVVLRDIVLWMFGPRRYAVAVGLIYILYWEVQQRGEGEVYAGVGNNGGADSVVRGLYVVAAAQINAPSLECDRSVGEGKVAVVADANLYCVAFGAGVAFGWSHHHCGTGVVRLTGQIYVCRACFAPAAVGGATTEIEHRVAEHLRRVVGRGSGVHITANKCSIVGVGIPINWQALALRGRDGGACGVGNVGVCHHRCVRTIERGYGSCRRGVVREDVVETRCAHVEVAPALQYDLYVLQQVSRVEVGELAEGYCQSVANGPI